ncbi:MAG: DUF4350 domain-containing protein [Verrucomicrobiaceae bacterium]|nr:DUF4350 domain-containing protein [Verrucomicrobiaceae bacterium]
MAQPANVAPASPWRRQMALVVLVGAIAGSIWYLYQMMSIRLDSGEMYPQYSSLRTDPLGTRALYESLQRIPGLTVERNFRPPHRIESHPGQAMLFAGLPAFEFSEDDKGLADEIQRIVADGTRMIVTMPSLHGSTIPWENINRSRSGHRKSSAKSDANDKKTEPKVKNSSGFNLFTVYPQNAIVMDKEGVPIMPSPNSPLVGLDLPSWHSIYSLSTEDPRSKDTKDSESAPSETSPWKVIATALGEPVIMERKAGLGSVVVCTDRYFLSNEALWSDPNPAFLSWLIGPCSKVVFEETHLGSMVGEDEGIMSLARRYHMHGLFFGCLALFGLIIWRGVSTLIPHDPSVDLGHWKGDAVAGMSAASGLEALLRRGIPFKQLLRRAFSIWQSTASASTRVPTDRIARANSELDTSLGRSASFNHFPKIYQQIRDTLHPSRKP